MGGILIKKCAEARVSVAHVQRYQGGKNTKANDDIKDSHMK